ncbi:signal peptidase II [Synechococcus sp. CCY 9618]|uniref:signal peptidase II n=1 Tax=Synechococcus sp. CCY 9618 TaxID=2815602 RepID=UPI00352EA083
MRVTLRRLAMLLLAALTVALDQLSKGWALEHLASGRIQPLLPGLLQLQRVRNTGAAFSLLTGAPALLGLVSAVVSLVLLGWILWRPPAGPWNVLALGLLLGGAVGNGIDRWRDGAVVDFLEFIPIHFPIFNIADVAINLAVACFLLDLLRPHADRHS